MPAIGRIYREQVPCFPRQPVGLNNVRVPAEEAISAAPEPGTEAMQRELEPDRSPGQEISVRPLAERDRLLFSLTNDNWLSMLGLPPGTGFGAGDDFGPTHSFKIELHLARKNASYLFGASSDLATREIAPRRTRPDGKDLATQAAIEVSKLYFAVELHPNSEGYTRLYGGVGLRNGQREIPGLAMWCQQGLHSMLKRAAAFDNVPTEPMQPFLELEAATGFKKDLPGLSDRLRIRGEIGATLNTITSGCRAFALVEADLPLAGPLHLRGAQLAQVLAGQQFSFVSSGGLSLEFPTWMIGAEAKLPLGAVDTQFMKYGDRDPLIELRIEVGI